jgi:hypothetical protein
MRTANTAAKPLSARRSRAFRDSDPVRTSSDMLPEHQRAPLVLGAFASGIETVVY